MTHKQTFSRGANPHPCVNFHDADHTPENKRPGSVDSELGGNVTFFPGNDHNTPWIGITLTESTNGRSRTISTYLHGDIVGAIRHLLAPDNTPGILTAVEFGYRQCEKGANLQAALAAARNA